MTRSVTVDGTEYAGAMKFRFADVSVSSYESGGEDLTPQDLGMYRFQKVEVSVSNGDGFTANYDESSGTIKVHGDGDGTSQSLPEVSAGTATELRVMAVGR